MTHLPPEHSSHDTEHHHHPYHEELVTVRDWLRYMVSLFNRKGISFGHGCENAFDEALWLLFHTLDIPREHSDIFLDASILEEEKNHLLDIIDQRVNQRVPTAYLTHEAWMNDFRFYVDERALIPRSFFGEFLEDSLTPWVTDAPKITEVLDLCTGSGCLAILLAHAFYNAHTVAADISADALAVAARNISDYGLEQKIELVQSDLFSALTGRKFDIIISNPPYVTAESMQQLPAEYRHEPVTALAGGDDGLDIVRSILQQAAAFLKPGGLLAIEIGHNRAAVEQNFPHYPFIWLSSSVSDDMIFILRAEDLGASA